MLKYVLCVCVKERDMLECSILQYLLNTPHRAGMCLLQWQTGKNKSAGSAGDVLHLHMNPSHSFFCCDCGSEKYTLKHLHVSTAGAGSCFVWQKILQDNVQYLS